MDFVDANVILELLLPRRRSVEAVATLLGSSNNLYTSTLTAHIVWYVCRRAKLADKIINKSLSDYQFIDLLAEDYQWALTNEKGKDFEDALQVSIALRSGSKHFITLDSKLIKAYAALPIEFINPTSA